jgi:hypothetical protein
LRISCRILDTKNKIDYDAAEHIHPYAVWTAAGAPQRGFAKTEITGSAIEASNLKKEVIALINKKKLLLKILKSGINKFAKRLK